MVRVCVTVGTLAEWDAHHLHRLRILCLGFMALFAGNASMLASQWEPGPGMLKIADFLPVVKVVTLFALVAEPPLVRILVAGGASTR